LNPARAAASRSPKAWRVVLAAVMLALAAAPAAHAQATPAAGQKPPDDTPSIKIGAVVFADYTYQQKPTTTDAAGNTINSSAFNLTRSYIDIKGNLSHIVAFRVTPDVTRETGTGGSLDGSLTFRVKYAFAQISLDDWLPKGTWVRFGVQQTPYVDSYETVYRYRFQGTIFPEREGYMSSADVGVSFRTTLPSNYGDIHVGVYNGEGYSKPEMNNKKALMMRVGFRPLPQHAIMKGWRVQGFYTYDNYMENTPRRRTVVDTTFEHPCLVVGFEYLSTTDKASSAPASGVALNPTLNGTGWGIFATPKKVFSNGSSIEALLRYDHMRPGGVATATSITSPDALNERFIGGVAYWFPKTGNVSSALLLDVENVTYPNYTPARPTDQRIFLHSLISF